MTQHQLRRFALPLAIVLVACSSPPEMMTPPPDGGSPPTSPYPYEPSDRVEDITLVDVERDREIPVRVFLPATVDAPPAAVVLSHGLGESRASFDYLGGALSDEGFVVVTITHIGSDEAAIAQALANRDVGGFGDPEAAQERPRDLRFVLDWLEQDAAGSALLEPIDVDMDRLGVGGQCAGSSTALSLVGLAITGFGDDFLDPRPRAALALGAQVPAGSLTDFLDGDSYRSIDRPVLYVTGGHDWFWWEEAQADPTIAHLPYDQTPEALRRSLHLRTAGHHAFTDSEPWYPAGPRDPRHHGWIAEAAVAFFHAELNGDATAGDWLDSGAIAAEAPDTVIQEQGAATELGTFWGAEGGTHAVQRVDGLLLHDAARDQDVPLAISYPSGAGPFPVVLFSHSAGATRDQLRPLVEHWASFGYVVIQPDHDDSPNVGELGPDEALRSWKTRPVDMSLILDSLDTIVAQAPELAGRMDGSRVGAAGAYIGGGTANLLIGTRQYESGVEPASFDDPRVRAAIALSPTGRGQGLRDDSWDAVTRPMLVVTGSRDASARTRNPPEWRTEPFELSAPGGKHLLWLDALDGSYGDLESSLDSVLAREVASGTLAFLDAYLREDPEALAYLEANGPQEASRLAAFRSR